MQHLFYPKRVAIIGVSESTSNIGRNVLNNLDRFSFGGEIYLVGPKGGLLNDRTIYRDIDEVPGKPDLAVILTPVRSVPKILDACGRRGIEWVIIESGGFSEYSIEGRQVEQQILDIARRHRIRLVGPNCLGIMNLENGLILPFAVLDPIAIRKGPISLISQSGGLALGVMKLLSYENLGLNKFVSIGNKIDLDENDYMDYLIKDPCTSIIGLFLESLSDGRQLMRLAMSTDKPIIILKGNVTSASHDIARFHTSALAGDNRVCNDAFIQAGIHHVKSIRELVSLFKIFSLPPMAGPKLAIITRSGGQAVLAADAASLQGFALPQISKKVLDFIRTRVRSGVIHMTNPLDLGDLFDIESYIDVIETLLKEEQINGIFVQHAFNRNVGRDEIAKPIHAIQGLSERYRKPVVVCFLTDQDECFQIKTSTDFPLFIETRDALEALAASYRHAMKREKNVFSTVSLKRRRQSSEQTFLADPEEAFTRFKSWGLPVADFRLVHNLETGLVAANEIGYPVVLKIATTKVLHKTEMKGVKIDIRDAQAFQTAFKEMREHFLPIFSAEESKFFVQKMVPPGVEVILGAKYDPEFGPVILFGLGGIFAEVLRDVAIRVAPVSESQAMEMVNQIKGSGLFKGFRGKPPADVEALLRILMTFSKILVDFPDVHELEINPLCVLDKGQGCVAADGRLRITQTTG